MAGTVFSAMQRIIEALTALRAPNFRGSFNPRDRAKGSSWQLLQIRKSLSEPRHTKLVYATSCSESYLSFRSRKRKSISKFSDKRALEFCSISRSKVLTLSEGNQFSVSHLGAVQCRVHSTLSRTSYLATVVYVSCHESEPADVHVHINTRIHLWILPNVKDRLSSRIVCATRAHSCFVSL